MTIKYKKFTHRSVYIRMLARINYASFYLRFKYLIRYVFNFVTESSFRTFYRKYTMLFFYFLKNSFHMILREGKKINIIKIDDYKNKNILKSPKGVKFIVLEKTNIIGKTSGIWNENTLIISNFYNLNTMRIAEESYPYNLSLKDNVISTNKSFFKLIKLKPMFNNSNYFSISLCAATSNNYAHWITESLPMLNYIIDYLSSQKKQIVVYVDEFLHKNIIETLNIFLTNSNVIKFIFVMPYESIAVKKLITVYGLSKSALDLIADRKLINSLKDWYFNHKSQALLVDKLDSSIESIDTNNLKKVFLLRTSAYRNLVNQKELANLAKKLGYTVLNLYTLSFKEQYLLFKNVEVVISPIGASLVNIIFNKKKCKVYIMCNKYWTNLHYWDALLKPYTSKITYIDSTKQISKKSSRHGNFFVNINKFKKIIMGSS